MDGALECFRVRLDERLYRPDRHRPVAQPGGPHRVDPGPVLVEVRLPLLERDVERLGEPDRLVELERRVEPVGALDVASLLVGDLDLYGGLTEPAADQLTLPVELGKAFGHLLEVRRHGSDPPRVAGSRACPCGPSR